MMSKLPFRNKWAIATVSLGKHSSHTLERKIEAAAGCGFSGIELVHADLLHHATSNGLSPLESARHIKNLCMSRNLEILSLNPLKNFEGNLSTPLEERLHVASDWINLAVAAGAKFVQLPSQFLQHSTNDDSVIIPELQALADLAGQSQVSIAYEPVAFAAFHATWQDGLRVVKCVDRPNFKLCLDSFHIHTLRCGDPYARNGQLPNGETEMAESMAKFLKQAPKDHLCYLQLSDGSRFDPPLTDNSLLFDGLEVKDARLAWSRSARPFPLEEPGYFPVVEIMRTWAVDYGWDGWFSVEGFLKETELEANGPEVMAERARRSIQALYEKVHSAA
ncbi:3-dehydroshikimate dehydratase [Colletotrichum siamense]|uniref:3-dehydroshikimate dehydratase n=1 Tax=Colletotrichum siamense TaxID=690259 RepID=A0A9P5EQE3_COLSI|nr:3-dehydroshikimate dehydratase [Colletotrichum siamense]KAF4857683.1 3-dehydroshikimate dehydratase [Colletotrichum siamense]